MHRTSVLMVVVICLAAAASATAKVETESLRPEVAASLAQLAVDSHGSARVELSPATGTARLVRLYPGQIPIKSASLHGAALAFFDNYGTLFGVHDPASELVAVEATVDSIGRSHQTYQQVHHGIEVFAGVLRAHSDVNGNLLTVNGAFVPELQSLDPIPVVEAGIAEEAALFLAARRDDLAAGSELEVASSALQVFRTNMARGLPGRNHLVWHVEVADRGLVIERIFIDAHSGSLVDRIDAVCGIHRIVYDQNEANLLWTEGDDLPYSSGDAVADLEINTIINATRETYDVFANLSDGDYLSWDGDDSQMVSYYRASFIDCPNAAASGGVTGFCPGVAADDTVAHEWTHNYTSGTHNLIYEWQPGALNEAYSDIFGEVVDLLNGSGTDAPDLPRAAGQCSVHGGSLPLQLQVSSPASVAGSYAAGGAAFNPAPPWSVSGTLELVSDGDGEASDGCEPLQGFTSGAVALIDRGSCFFYDKVAHAEDAGAIAVVVVNNQGDDILEMGGTGSPHHIPALLIGQSDGELLKAVLGDGVQVSMQLAASTDPSVRWVASEDDPAFGGAIRDMWNPNCFSDPAKVSDSSYHCSDDDGGGVHSNSGVPNHAFALLVDGGTFNGVSVQALGINKAGHIYWRAMRYYQVPTTGFFGHADFLEISCEDLVGAALTDLWTGGVSSEVITTTDCEQVTAAMEAVEMRRTPVQCDFETLLEEDAPELEGYVEVFVEEFDSDPMDRWSVSNQGVDPSYRPRDWQWLNTSPVGGDGGSIFADDRISVVGDCTDADGDQSGVMFLYSPEIQVPGGSSALLLVFDHFVATERAYDGGNLRISVNGGPFMLVLHSAFNFNPYNSILSAGSNPLALQFAFTGTNAGSSGGSWGQSQIDLAAIAGAGDSIVLRFNFGVDYCNGVDGWYLDNVRVLAKGGPMRPGGGRIGG